MYTLTWTSDDGSKKTKTHESLEEAVREAISLKSPMLRDESTGHVYKESAICGMYDDVTGGKKNA